jgi:hypothetical protein
MAHYDEAVMSRCAPHFGLLYFCRCIAAALVVTVVGCTSTSKESKEEKPGTKADAAPAKEDNKPDASFLLTMSYTEASAISPQKMVMAPFYKIAADEITVASVNSEGQPRRVRAKGHVFVQIDFRDEVRALGQEALIENDEVIIRGRPLMKRGPSVVEGLDDRTVLFIRGLKLQVIGTHRLTNDTGVTPAWKGKWQDGPNPLLPALSPEDVPKEMRASPLLPSLNP